MSDLRFQKLTPTSNVDLNVYEEGFEFIFSNDDIRNIAVSGPYSSGKSSLLESYKKKYPQKTFIHTQQLLEKQLKELKKQKKRISGRSISQIINRDNIDMIFQITTTNELGDVTDYNQIKKSEYFNLLKYLIRN